jgi:cytochrome c oxidase assembly protein subunit 15
MADSNQEMMAPTPNGLLQYARITAGSIFFLIVAGALITGNKAALSDPTWPTFAGNLLPTRETFVGGLRFEDSHRVIAGTVGILTLILAVLLQKFERNALIRKIAWGAVALVVVQALVGALIILLKRPQVTSVVHAFLGQSFLVTGLAIASMLSISWKQPQLVGDRDGLNKAVRMTALIGTGEVFVQLVFGALTRHTHDEEHNFIAPLLIHISGAVIVWGISMWLVMLIFKHLKSDTMFRRIAYALPTLLLIQTGLGVWSIFANRDRLEDSMPWGPHVMMTTAHVATGALILSTLFMAALFAHRRLPVGMVAPGRTLSPDRPQTAA